MLLVRSKACIALHVIAINGIIVLHMRPLYPLSHLFYDYLLLSVAPGPPLNFTGQHSPSVQSRRE